MFLLLASALAFGSLVGSLGAFYILCYVRLDREALRRVVSQELEYIKLQSSELSFLFPDRLQTLSIVIS